MEKEQILESIKKARESSKKRNFNQSFDLIISVKELDLKKTENQKELFVAMPFATSKKMKVCALIGQESIEEAKVCDKAIAQDRFIEYDGNDKAVKKLASEFDYFIAQANIMPAIAKIFGKVLGRRGKMPNPKAGCIFPPKTNLKPLYERLQRTVRLKLKTASMVQCRVGMENMKDEEIGENILSVYNAFVRALPAEQNNIKNVYLKTTMGKPIKIV